MASLIGRTFDGYELKEFVGSSGWVEVYKGFNHQISRWAVLRFMSRAVIADEELAQFRRWAQAIAALRHPNISIIYGYGEAEGWVYIILEDAPGGSLKDRLVSDNPFAWDQALTIVIPISQALAYAHKQGITNWAIEPANIFLPQEEWPLLSADFELPKSLRTSDDVIYLGFLENEMVREFTYTAPETIQGNKTDARSDVYSLGAILYELLSGRLPYEGETSFDLLLARLSEPPLPLTQINPDLPRVFELILSKALALDPDDRYQTMDEFEQVLSEARKRLNRSIAGKYQVVEGEDEATASDVSPHLRETEIVLKLSQSGQEIFVGEQAELTIGRASKKGNIPNLDIDLMPYGGHQGGVSRRHGRLLYKDDQWFVEDLGSTNGTFVNGVKISSQQMVPVYHGDILRFGRIELEFNQKPVDG